MLVSTEGQGQQLVYNYFRDYDRTTGRYIQSDPIGLTGGLNLFLYSNANPVVLMDPLGLTSIAYDVANGEMIIDPEQPGRKPYSISATSGKGQCENAPACEAEEDRGPIPRGEFTALAEELSDPGLVHDMLRNIVHGDWGDWRISLHPNPGTEVFGRSGFFIHGGKLPGSAGCIDIGGGLFGNELTDLLKADILADPDGRIPVKVK